MFGCRHKHLAILESGMTDPACPPGSGVFLIGLYSRVRCLRCKHEWLAKHDAPERTPG